MNSGRVKKVLITGGAGFIGSAVVRQFINETDVTVVNVDAGNLESLASVSGHPCYFFEHAGMLDRAAVERIFQQCKPDIDRKDSDPFIAGYIDNTVQMNLLAAMTDNDEATDQVYSVALNDRTSLNQLYQMIEERLIQRVKSLTRKEPIYREFRAGDVRHSQADISKAQQLLGYQPSHKIAEGLDEAMDWYVEMLK